MCKCTIIMITIIWMLLGFTTLTAAVTYGEPDGVDGHPYVGIVAFYIEEDGQLIFVWPCTGVLISPQVLLTAGHCTYGTTTARVWFDADLTDLLYPDPDCGQFPCVGGMPIPHPQYNDNWSDFPNTYDVGIVLLDAPVEMDEYGFIPELRVLDDLSTRRGKQDLLFRTVGYGWQSVRPMFQADRIRYTATSKLVNLRSHLTDGYNLHTSNNPGQGNGTGGSCFGDSGGPIFFPEDSNQVVGIVSFGLNNNCKGADFGYRTDIEDAQNFIIPYLDAE